ncbi:hypothetical protein ANCCEY_02761 [Ancylostoma ceylanicum]|uniref:Selenoprotein F/M domain-containing protein n=1 Tax=Ancylostoma ceylanicum TaxID=53326 RepID=A0A0D6M6R5_9BILA|nr:hypothetical protein ANCCEY_02761 [Ancylostoma ceylanicum]
MAHIEVCECNLARFPQVQGKFRFLHFKEGMLSQHERFIPIYTCVDILIKWIFSAFVRENMASHWGGKVRVRQVRGVRPQIKLKGALSLLACTCPIRTFQDDAGITKQTLNIEKWDTDTIKDFLNQWID